jgi:nucleotide-binding universal stress UspA family protein
VIEIKKILAATDFSEHAEYAIRWAVELAQRFGAEVRLLHVYDYPTYALPDGALIPAADVVSNLLVEVEEQLEAEQHKFEGRGVAISIDARQGAAAEEIAACAAEWSADLIVVGTHGRGALAHLLIGSVAERVVRKAHCPVTTVRLPGFATSAESGS